MKTAIKLVLIYFVMQILGDAFHNALFLRGQRYDR